MKILIIINCLIEAPHLELVSDYNNLTLRCNQEFLFNVSIISVPNDERALEINWYKNGLMISSRHNKRIGIIRFGSDFTNLIINNTISEDSGIYRVEANLLSILYANISLNLTVKGCGSNYDSKGFRFRSIISSFIKKKIYNNF